MSSINKKEIVSALLQYRERERAASEAKTMTISG
jgi:hypothetical protein